MVRHDGFRTVERTQVIRREIALATVVQGHEPFTDLLHQGPRVRRRLSRFRCSNQRLWMWQGMAAHGGYPHQVRVGTEPSRGLLVGSAVHAVVRP